jgi:hypothetical protein
LNVFIWLASTKAIHARHGIGVAHPRDWTTTHLQLLLSAGYVLGCAYRSVFPVYDVQRIVMVDSWLSSVMVGRSVATVAELCFAAQWALFLRSVAQSCGNVQAIRVSQLIVPLIVVAEAFSWYAVLTTANIGHVMEESIWGLCAALLVGSFLYLFPRSERAIRPLLLAGSVAGVAYVIFMFQVDVPMYWARWVLDEARGHTYFSVAQGIADASGRWVVSHHWQDWESEVVWMSLYFSVAVWLSIGLTQVSSFIGPHRTSDPLKFLPRSRMSMEKVS